MKYNRVWTSLFWFFIFCASAMEILGFVLETFFGLHQFPTLSSMLVDWFSPKSLAIVTVCAGLIFAIHWDWVKRQKQIVEDLIDEAIRILEQDGEPKMSLFAALCPECGNVFNLSDNILIGNKSAVVSCPNCFYHEHYGEEDESSNGEIKHPPLP